MLEYLELLTHLDHETRLDALEHLVDLAETGSEPAREALWTVVREYCRFDREIYGRALNRVWLFGDPALEDSLLAALGDDEYDCQPWAARACAALGFRSAVPGTRALLGDSRGWVRADACDVLGDVAATEAVAELGERLNDPDDFVREAAAGALAAIGGSDALGMLWESFTSLRHVRAGHLAAALARFGSAGFDLLAQAAADGSPDLRYWAARGLGATSDARAVPILERMVADDHDTTRTGGRVSTAARKGLKTLRRTTTRTRS